MSPECEDDEYRSVSSNPNEFSGKKRAGDVRLKEPL